MALSIGAYQGGVGGTDIGIYQTGVSIPSPASPQGVSPEPDFEEVGGGFGGGSMKMPKTLPPPKDIHIPEGNVDQLPRIVAGNVQSNIGKSAIFTKNPGTSSANAIAQRGNTVTSISKGKAGNVKRTGATKAKPVPKL